MKALFVTSFALVAATLTVQQADPRDFSGHWDRTSPIVSFGNVPTGAARENPGVQEAPFTPEGRAMYEANRPGYGPRRSTRRNDPLGRCEPLGLVRHLDRKSAG